MASVRGRSIRLFTNSLHSPYASSTTPLYRHFTISHSLHLEDQDSRLPRIANPSLWASFIPKSLRNPSDSVEAAERDAKRNATNPKEWNPYTIFIVLGVLVGSNAIQLISLRNDTLNFTRQTDAKLELLREVVQRVKNGEEVDVKRLLGTGDPLQEREWEEVVEELEGTDMVGEGRRKRQARMQEKEEAKRVKTETEVREEEAKRREGEVEKDTSGSKAGGRPKFVM